MIKSIWKRIKSLGKDTAKHKGGADKWGEKQIKEMAKLRGKLILM